MPQKNASSQAALALLTKGVASARIEAHRLKHLINRAVALADKSPAKEHIQQVAGDILLAVPQRLEHLERHLDRTALALSKMGEDFLEARLPMSDKTEVEEAVQPAFGGGKMRTSVDRLAQRWVMAAGAKITPKIKTEFGRRAKKLGLDGNGRFPSIGRAINAIHGALEEEYDLGGGVKVSMELDDIPSADLFRGDEGSRTLHLAFKTDDPFSPNPIGNSMLSISWHYIKETDKYEVLAYLS